MNPSKNFIEHIIDEDLKQGLSKESLRFRFPPEPNGFLHIGHVKAICINFGLGLSYNAPVNLRFDDTNPAAEEKLYVDAIKKDIQWLGFRWDKECYASDYFQALYDWAVDLIKLGNGDSFRPRVVSNPQRAQKMTLNPLTPAPILPPPQSVPDSFRSYRPS